MRIGAQEDPEYCLFKSVGFARLLSILVLYPGGHARVSVARRLAYDPLLEVYLTVRSQKQLWPRTGWYLQLRKLPKVSASYSESLAFSVKNRSLRRDIQSLGQGVRLASREAASSRF